MKRKYVTVTDNCVTVAYLGSERASLLSPILEEKHTVHRPHGKYYQLPQEAIDDPFVVFLRDELTNKLIDIQVYDSLPTWWENHPADEPDLAPEYVDAMHAIREARDAREPRGSE